MKKYARKIGNQIWHFIEGDGKIESCTLTIVGFKGKIPIYSDMGLKKVWDAYLYRKKKGKCIKIKR